MGQRDRQLAARADTELHEHLGQVELHGVGTDEQSLTDFRIRQPVTGVTRDLDFLLGLLKKTVVTGFVGIHTLYLALLRLPDIASVDFSKLKFSGPAAWR